MDAEWNIFNIYTIFNFQQKTSKLILCIRFFVFYFINVNPFLNDKKVRLLRKEWFTVKGAIADAA